MTVLHECYQKCVRIFFESIFDSTLIYIYAKINTTEDRYHNLFTRNLNFKESPMPTCGL